MNGEFKVKGITELKGGEMKTLRETDRQTDKETERQKNGDADE